MIHSQNLIYREGQNCSTILGNEAKQSKCEKSERTQIFPSDIKFSSQTTGNDYAQVQRNVDNDSKPLTRTNVTQHDKIWVKDERKNEIGKLIPPPETGSVLTDPLDCSACDLSVLFLDCSLCDLFDC
jgi:hypothetical protein